MAEIRTIRYADGRWCEQQYVDGKLHGTWTVFFADGAKEWERQHARDRKEGYFRRWDKAGRLIEEQWYH
jgi:antitoxin component YwqK of YwqJK toxin-antitoxin module